MAQPSAPGVKLWGRSQREAQGGGTLDPHACWDPSSPDTGHGLRFPSCAAMGVSRAARAQRDHQASGAPLQPAPGCGHGDPRTGCVRPELVLRDSWRSLARETLGPRCSSLHPLPPVQLPRARIPASCLLVVMLPRAFQNLPCHPEGHMQRAVIEGLLRVSLGVGAPAAHTCEPQAVMRRGRPRSHTGPSPG